MQEVIKDLLHHLIRLANRDIMLLYEDAGDSFLLAESSHCFYFFLRDGTFVNYFFSDKTIGSVHGYISIDQVPVLQFGKIVDNGFRASGSDKYFKPFCVGGFQCLNGRRRDTVCFETNQRSVYIKK